MFSKNKSIHEAQRGSTINKKNRSDSISQSIHSELKHGKFRKSVVEVLIDTDVAPSVKKIIERLSYLYNQHRELHETSRKKFITKITEKQVAKVADLVEMISCHRALLNSCQMGLSSAFFLSTTLESIISMWAAHANYKNDVKVCIKNNSKLSHSATVLTQDILDLQTKKSCIIDEITFYKEMWEIYYVDQDEDYEKFEDQIWEILLTALSDTSLPMNLVNIDIFLGEDQTSQIEAQLNEYLEEGRTNEHIGSSILNIGKRCLYLDAPDVALRIIKIANNVLRRFTNPKSIKANLLPFAEAFALKSLNNKTEATKILKTVSIEIDQINFTNEIEKGYISLLIGYFLLKWKENETGFKMLEMSVDLLDECLPDSEVLWTKSVNWIARFYNENDKTDLAFANLTKVLDYYHEKIHGPITSNNKPIYMVANEAKNISRASVLLMETLSSQLGYLPQSVMATVRELIVTFSIQGNLNAVGIVEKFMHDSIMAYKDFAIDEDVDALDNKHILKLLKFQRKDKSGKKSIHDLVKKKKEKDNSSKKKSKDDSVKQKVKSEKKQKNKDESSIQQSKEESLKNKNKDKSTKKKKEEDTSVIKSAAK